MNLTTFSPITDDLGNTSYPKGHYYIIMQATGKCSQTIRDSIAIFISGGLPVINASNSICIGQTIQFVGSNNCPDFWHWDFGDGTSAKGNDTVWHTYNAPGNFTVTLQTTADDSIAYHTISVVQPLQNLSIIGPNNTCNKVVYTINNIDTSYNYVWSTKIFNSTTNQYTAGSFLFNNGQPTSTADSVFIDWTSASFPILPNYVVIEVTATYPGTNCSSISQQKVFECCINLRESTMKGLIWNDTTLSSDLQLQGVEIAINGTLHITSDVTSSNASSTIIWFGPEAKIVVDSGGSLELYNTYLRNGCDYMWDGVYVLGNSSSASIYGTSIEASINGIVSQNGGNLILDNNNFSDNNYSVQVLDYKPNLYTPPGSFVPLTFKFLNNDAYSGNTNGLMNLYPYFQKQPKATIYISNVKDINIGNIPTGTNTFADAENAIKIYNSEVTIMNNHFDAIVSNNSNAQALDLGAINISSSSSYLYNICKVTIGGPGLQSNVFESCEQGITSNNALVTIENNVFKNGLIGVKVLNLRTGTSIFNNRFKDTEFGIRIENPIAVARKLTIHDNYFEGITDGTYSSIMRGAINLINCQSAASSSLKAQVNNNTIKYTGPRQFETFGIRLQNCNGVKVNSNFIARPAGPSIISNDWDKLHGIRVASTQAAEIADNYIYGFGTSIITYGNDNLTQFSCNEMHLYKYGFWFDGFTSLTNQGIYDLRNTHNQWDAFSPISGNEKLATPSAINIQNPFLWYYFSSFGNQWIPNDVYLGIFLKIDATPNDAPSVTHLCVSSPASGGAGSSTGGGSEVGNGENAGINTLLDDLRTDPELRDLLLEEMLAGIEYANLTDQYRAYDADFIYKALRDDTTMMFLGGENDADYQSFFDSIAQSELGKLTEVYELIEVGDFAAAQTKLNSIAPQQDIHLNLKTVLEIYLGSWCNERYALTETEHNTLQSIALQTPYAAGDGVYTARVMLCIDPDDYGITYKQQKPQSSISDEIKLFPNPAHDQVNIDFGSAYFDEVHLKIYTIGGQLVQNYTANAKFGFLTLPIPELGNGVYLYNLILSDGSVKSGKLVVIKN